MVRVEETAARDGEVAIQTEVPFGCDIRRAGEDITAGETVLSAGARVGPAELGVLASVGARTVACHRRPRVSVLVSGDELLEPDAADAARRRSQLQRVLAAGAGRVGRRGGPPGRVGGRRPRCHARAIAAALDADVLVISGGVSVGEHDHVKQALAELGVTEHFWGISLKPGKPAWFGSRAGDAGLRPAGQSGLGDGHLHPAGSAGADGAVRREARGSAHTAVLARDYDKRPGRTHAVRCRLELRKDGWHADPFERQGSHVLTSMLGADCLAIIPTASGPLKAGEPVEIELLA